MPGMGLRGRLALFFLVITIVPVTVAIGVLQAQIAAEAQTRASAELAQTGTSVAALIEAARVRAGDLATDLATREGITAALASPGAAEAWLADRPIDERADIVVLAAPDGPLLAHRGPTPDAGAAEAVARQAAAIATAPDTPPQQALLAVRVVQSAGLVAAGIWLDEDLLAQVLQNPPPGGGAALVVEGTAMVATGPTPAVGDLPQPGTVGHGEVAGERVLVGVTDLSSAPGTVLALWTPAPRGPGVLLTIVVPTTAVIAAALGWYLAGSVIAPVRRAAETARAVADGDLSRKLSPSGGRELGELAHALNAMSAELGARLTEVERSRDELRRSLTRLGEALSGTLDMGRMLSVVVESAADTLRADGAALLLVTPEGDALEAHAVHGLAPTGRMGADEGVAGHVVRTGHAVRLPGSPAVPARAAGEAQAPYLLAVPLRGRGRTNGALVLLRQETSGEFGEEDLRTASSIAAGIAVAVENIRLHEETERLSLTNPVTGLWNNRYFEPQVDAELARARRANERGGARREVSVLAIDLDRFGRINKEYDQAAGDAALAEVGRRLQKATREPDVVTHPHGEEFAVLLPDTGYEGALRVAERMRAAVAQSPVSLPDAGPNRQAVDVELTCSVGVATFQRHADDRVPLYRAADRAMQVAKERGRNRVVGADELSHGSSAQAAKR